MNEPKDGFDLIEYPCDYLFKVMCRVDESVEQTPKLMVEKVILEHVAADALLSIDTQDSRTGKFQSVSATVKLESRESLETIYGSIAKLPNVVMTL